MLRLEKMPVTLIISLVYANCSFNEILMLPCEKSRNQVYFSLPYLLFDLHAISLFNSKLRHVFTIGKRKQKGRQFVIRN